MTSSILIVSPSSELRNLSLEVDEQRARKACLLTTLGQVCIPTLAQDKAFKINVELQKVGVQATLLAKQTNQAETLEKSPWNQETECSLGLFTGCELMIHLKCISSRQSTKSNAVQLNMTRIYVDSWKKRNGQNMHKAQDAQNAPSQYSQTDAQGRKDAFNVDCKRHMDNNI